MKQVLRYTPPYPIEQPRERVFVGIFINERWYKAGMKLHIRKFNKIMLIHRIDSSSIAVTDETIEANGMWRLHTILLEEI